MAERMTTTATDAPNPWDGDAPHDYTSSWVGSAHYLSIVNRRITGDPARGWFDHALTRYVRPDVNSDQQSILLLGSNEGHMELALRRAGFRGPIVASDIAGKALARAKARTEAAGFTDIEHRVVDLNKTGFEDRFDFIIAEGVLHHIERLEFCLANLSRALKPGGLLIAMEFTGAFRFQWPAQQVAWINAALAAVPRRLRPMTPDPRMAGMPPSAEDRARVYFVPPPAEAMMDFDQSEAVSGHRLHAALLGRFDPVEVKRGGGSLIMNMTGHFPIASVDTDPQCRQWFDVMVAIEDAAVDQGLVNSDLMFYVLRRRP